MTAENYSSVFETRRKFLAGLAYRILEAQFWLDTPRAFAALFVLAVTGVAIFSATSAVSYFAMRRWHESAAEREN